MSRRIYQDLASVYNHIGAQDDSGVEGTRFWVSQSIELLAC